MEFQKAYRNAKDLEKHNQFKNSELPSFAVSTFQFGDKLYTLLS